MGALGAECLDLAGGVDEEDLGVGDALDLDLPLCARREGQGRNVLEPVFLGHGSYAQGEAARRRTVNRLEEASRTKYTEGARGHICNCEGRYRSTGEVR